MDPKDPDGSYDMCLSRPGTMLNVCKIPLNNCGIDATSESAAEKSNIWEFVVARLASMRVDSCTTAVKECLISDDRCGKDYAGCIGLDTDTIIKMCPYDKLTGCQKKYGDTDIRGDNVYEELYNMVQGIMLNIDNNMMAQCQKAADAAMVKVCGDTTNCDALTVDENIGARSLGFEVCLTDTESKRKLKGLTASSAKKMTVADVGKTIVEKVRLLAEFRNAQTQQCYSDLNLVPEEKMGKDGAEVSNFVMAVTGEIPWDTIKIVYPDDQSTQNVADMLDISELEEYLSVLEQGEADKIRADVGMMRQNISHAINVIESDPTVQFCITGRKVQGMKQTTKDKDGKEVTTRDEFGDGVARFPALTSQMRSLIAASVLRQAQDNYSNKHEEVTKQMAKEYVNLREKIAEFRAEEKAKVRREAGRVSCLGLADASVISDDSDSYGSFGQSTNDTKQDEAPPYTGTSSSEDHSYRETVTSTFNPETFVCRKCVRSQKCDKVKGTRVLGYSCKSWGEEQESCSDTQF